MTGQNFKVKHGIAIAGSSQDTLITSDNNGGVLIGGNPLSRLPQITPNSANVEALNPNTVSLSVAINDVALDNGYISFYSVGQDSTNTFTSSDLNIINAAMPAGNYTYDGFPFTVTTPGFIENYYIRFENVTTGTIAEVDYVCPAAPSIYKDLSNQGFVLTNDGTVAYWNSLTPATPSTKGSIYGSTLNDNVNNTAIGIGALSAVISSQNVSNTQNTAIGFNALNAVTDQRNTAIGEHAAPLMQSGRNNVFIGDGSAENLTTGYGENLTIIGHNTAPSLLTTNATNITLVGAFSDTADGSSNVVAIGDHSFSGNNGISIGSQSSTSTYTNSIAIGYQTTAGYDNQITLGNASTNRLTIPGLGIDWWNTNLSNPTPYTSILTASTTGVYWQDISIPVAGTDFIAFSEKGTAGGVATLDGNGYIPSSQLSTQINGFTLYGVPAVHGVATLNTYTAFSQIPYGGQQLSPQFSKFSLAPYGSFTTQDLAIFNAAFPVGSVVTATDATQSGTFTITQAATINGGGYIIAENITTSESNTIFFSGATTLTGGVSTAGKFLTNDGTTTSWASTINGDLTLGGNTTISGNLTVNGTTETINSTTLTVADKNIELGNVATPTNTTADGGGITLHGTTDKTIQWDSANANWTSSEHFNLASGKSFKINNVSLNSVSETLSNKTLGATSTTTLSANTATAIDTVALNSFTGIKYFVTISQGTKKRVSELHVVTDGTSVNYVEYGTITLGSNLTGFAIAATTSSTNMVLNITITDAVTTNATIKINKVVM
jgi:hypothetical protein